MLALLSYTFHILLLYVICLTCITSTRKLWLQSALAVSEFGHWHINALTRSPVSSACRYQTGNPPGPWIAPRPSRYHRTQSDHLERTKHAYQLVILTKWNICGEVKKKYIIIYNNICISDRFLVWRESSQWCGPALLWFPESGLLHSGGSSPSSAWLFWPAHCPSGGPYSKQHSGVKLLLQDTNKSSITLTVLTHQLRHSAASHHQSAFHISHMMWQVKFLRHQV